MAQIDPAYFSQDYFPTNSKLIIPRVGWPRYRRSASNLARTIVQIQRRPQARWGFNLVSNA
jgi:hypothetical protein